MKKETQFKIIEGKIDLPRLFVQSGLGKRKDSVIDKFYLEAIKALSQQCQEFKKIIKKVSGKEPSSGRYNACEEILKAIDK